MKKSTLFFLAAMLLAPGEWPAQTSVLRVSETSLTFRAPAGGDATPARVVRVTPVNPERPVRFGVSLEPAPDYRPPDWLQVFGVPGDGGVVARNTPARLIARASPARLDPGVYKARIRLAPVDNPTATSVVEVEFQVVAAPPELEVFPGILRFVARRGGGPRSQALMLRNAGGRGVTPVRPEFARPVSWASFTAVGALDGPGDLAVVRVTVDPSGLRPGVYRTQLRFEPPPGQDPVVRPIALLVLDDSGILQADPGGLRFEMRQGEGTIVTRRVQIINAGPAGTLRWAARILQGAEWMRLSAASGEAGAEPGGFDVQVSNRNLDLGEYYGLIEVASPGALGSPQYVTVTVQVQPPDRPAGPVAVPEGLLFVVNEGGAPATQRVRIFASAQGRVGFQAATATEDNLGWLRAASATGDTSTDAPADMELTVSPANLKAGFYFGEMNLTLSNDEIRSVNIAAVVVPRGAAAAGASADGCAPRRLAAVVTSLVSNFSTPAGWPAPITVRVADDCGNPVNNAQAVVSFSNGDPPLPLRRFGGDGVYTATWAPNRTAGQMNVTVRVSAQDLEAAVANLTGEVTASGAPVLAPGGTVNNFSFAGEGVIAPGMVASVFGANLAGSGGQAATAELPREIAGTRVLVSGLPAPLYFATPAQLGIQIPHELPDAVVHQIVVSANGQLSVPDTLEAAPAAPGLLAAGEALVAQRPDGSFVNAAAPARRGEALVLYLVGMGRTDPGAVTGSPAPALLASVRQAPVVTVGDVAARVLFAGLTPGFVGLYQINFLVPDDAPPGNHPVEVTQNGFFSNRATLPVGP